MDTTHDDLEAGIRAVRQGNRERARQHLLRILQAEPQHQAAWFWISRAMPTTAQALRCIDHLLQINPRHAQALEEREVLRLRMLLEESALQPSQPRTLSTPQHRYLLGEALVEARIISAEQLQIALREQARIAEQRRPLRLGQVLPRLNFVTPMQLEAAIAAQAEAHAGTTRTGGLGRIGEYLLRRRIVTRAQLHQGLARQRALQAAGIPARLGEVLVELGYISPETLKQALRDWEREYESAFY